MEIIQAIACTLFVILVVATMIALAFFAIGMIVSLAAIGYGVGRELLLSVLG